MTVARITEIPPVALLPNVVVQKKVLKPLRIQAGGTILVSTNPCSHCMYLLSLWSTAQGRPQGGPRSLVSPLLPWCTFTLSLLTILQAGKLAVERGWAINIGGGFHHCSSERGGGFCAYADITLAIKVSTQSSIQYTSLFHQKISPQPVT